MRCFSPDISHLYFCIHQPTADIQQVAGELARYKERNGSDIEYTFVNSESAPVWASEYPDILRGRGQVWGGHRFASARFIARWIAWLKDCASLGYVEGSEANWRSIQFIRAADQG